MHRVPLERGAPVRQELLLLLLRLEPELPEEQEEVEHEEKVQEGVPNEASLERCFHPRRFTRESSTPSRFVCGNFVRIGTNLPAEIVYVPQ